MKAIKKVCAAAAALILMAGLVPALPAKAAGGVLVQIQAADTGTISYKYSEKKKLVLKVTNLGSEDAQDIKITPRISEQTNAWPFEIENKDYAQVVEQLAKGQSTEVEYEFTARENVSTQYYKLVFDYTYTGSGDSSQKGDGEYGMYVKTIAKPEKEPEPSGGQNKGQGNGSDDNQNQPAQGTDEPFPVDAGGISNSEPAASGGGANGSVPRVIVTGFSTDPQEVKAGSNFKLTIHLKNTSKKTAVSNMLFDLSAPTEGSDENTSAPAFLPASGSSSVYLEGIGADGTKDITIELNAKADLVQKPYSIQLSMKYEDSQAAQFEGSSAISIPVKQDARFEFSEFEISPESVEVGGEANVMCQLYNMGRIKLYNVKAKFEGKGIQTSEVFVGNVEPGATAGIDGMVTAESATDGPEKMKMTLSYEDESGKISSTEKEFELIIGEPVDDVGMMDMPDESEQGKFPVVPIVIAVVMIIGTVIGIVIYKKKKHKKSEEEEERLADEFDRLTEDEPREP